VTENARARILAAGGNIITLDQLAQQAPKGQNTVLMQGASSRDNVPVQTSSSSSKFLGDKEDAAFS